MQFKFTPQRVADCCSVSEYVSIMADMKGTTISVLPRFVVNDQDEYIVEVIYNEDGNIQEYKNLNEAYMLFDKIPVRQIDGYAKELVKACKDIVNPPKGEGSKVPSPSEAPQRQAGS